MKILSLNIWGGKLSKSLNKFLEKHSKEIDIFCLQEVYDSPLRKRIARGMYSNNFTEISQILSAFQCYFSPAFKNYDLNGRVNFDLFHGLAVFVKKSIPVETVGDIFIYRKRDDLLLGKYQKIPRNLQYIIFKNNNGKHLLGHFHGIWYPKTKLDTSERIEQATKIRVFLNRFQMKKILCGDFNLLPFTKSVSILEKGMRNLIKEYKVPTTRNKFYKRREKIADYILVSPDVKVVNLKVLNVLISDHLPLILEIS